jgi:chromosomal replication initiation ATPase DnaA
MTFNEVLKIAGKEYLCIHTDLLRTGRIHPYMEARQMAVYVYCTYLGGERKEVSKQLEKDASTITAGLKRIRERMSVEKPIRQHYSNIIYEIDKILSKKAFT